MNDILQKIALELLIEAAPQYVPQNMKLPFSNISIASGAGTAQTQIMGNVFQQNDLPIQKFLDSFSFTDEGSKIRMTRMAITLLRFLTEQAQYDAYKEYANKEGITNIAEYSNIKRELAPAYGFTNDVGKQVSNIQAAKDYFIEILNGSGTGLAPQNLQTLVNNVANKLSTFPQDENERRVFLSYLETLDNETNNSYKPNQIKEIISQFTTAPANAAPGSPGSTTTTNASGDSVSITPSIAEFVGLLEFMESRKETIARMGLGDDDTTKQQMQIELKDTNTFITRFFLKFRKILSFIFTNANGFKSAVGQSKATKTFLDKAKDYIYRDISESKNKLRRQESFKTALRELDQIIPTFFNDLKAEPELQGKDILSIETKVKGYIQAISKKILDYYTTGDPGKLVSLFNFSSLDIPEYKDASSAPTSPPVTETLNLNNKSQNTSKLIIESITKSKKINVKGTKEQITLFNKLIKEELSIMNKIKNNKPYIIPTKDIENFESLTGIVWPFKE